MVSKIDIKLVQKDHLCRGNHVADGHCLRCYHHPLVVTVSTKKLKPSFRNNISFT